MFVDAMFKTKSEKYQFRGERMAIAEQVEKALTTRLVPEQLAEACGYASQSHVGNTLR